jgi:8-oxo-dGTP pyrophosphatase MutT (NUDIX family)/RimJ/RimL family protein N-acetyltransferase
MGEIQRTWDGNAIAEEDPRGCAVLVRRQTQERGIETLLLHRAHNGPEYEGDWAWTSPAGARMPGEPVYTAAVRELAEEAGLTGVELVPDDLSTPWARFLVEVPPETEIDLVDPEHDRYEWVSVEEAQRRAAPRSVSDGFNRLADRRYGPVAFEPVTEADLGDIVDWQSSPLAQPWFAGSPATVDEARERYGARIAGQSPTRMWVVVIEGARVGYAQGYHVGAYDEYAEKTGDPEAVGFDYLIAEPGFDGWGRVMIWAFMRDILCAHWSDAPRFLASPSHRNRRSIRALEACGLNQGVWIDVAPRPGEPPETEVVCTIDRRLWFG